MRSIFLAIVVATLLCVQGCDRGLSGVSVTAKNKQLVHQWLQDVDRNGVSEEVTKRWMATDFRMYLAGMPEPVDLAGYRTMASSFYDNFSDVRHEIHHVVAEGDLVAVRATIHGRQTGAFQGIAPTGRRTSVAQSVMVRVHEGRIVEEWVLNDTASLLRQISTQ